jgi:hypothetical protein
MSTNISDYTVLNTYAVLASSGITTINTTTITNGVYGTPAGTGIVGSFIGTLDGANATTAQTQLTTLVNAINAVTITSTITGGGGIITYTPGRYNSVSTIIYNSGTNIILDAQGNSSAQFFFTAGSGITFTSVSSITLINGASNCNVFWLAGTIIDFTGTSPSSIPGIFIAGSMIAFDNASIILGRLYAQTANITFSGLSSSVDAICTQNIVCYKKGTLILTDQGIVSIENIQVGDNVLTKGKIYNYKFIKQNANIRVEPVIWIGKFHVDHINLNTNSRPICIKKNALDENYPFQDLYVSPEHCLLINGKMITASSLINGNTIYQDMECNNVEYYHLECKKHCAIFANNVLAETYLDANNRNVFDK